MHWKSEKLYFEEDLYFADVLSALDQAKSTVEIETYIFEDDFRGLAMVAKLKEISARGVQVKLLIDAIGSIFWSKAISQAFSGSKVEVKFFRAAWWNWWRMDLLFKRLAYLNRRLHRKICLIDNQILFLGSFNICHKDSRETGARVEASHFDELRQSFDKLWRKRWYFQRRHFSRASAMLRFNETRSVRRMFNRDLAGRIHGARKKVWITNAYFVPPIFLIKAFVEAARRQVDVKLLLPARSDLPFFKALTATFYRTLLVGRVRIFEYKGQFLHAKSILIDDWATVGSSNLNHRSLLHDYEIDVVLESDKSLQSLETQFLLDQAHAVEVREEDLKKYHFIEKLVGWTLLAFKRWL